jgi:hypothetical protein
MGVDETGQERRVAQVDDLGILRRTGPLGHGDDALAVEQHHRVRSQCECRAVVQPGRSECDAAWSIGEGGHHGHRLRRCAFVRIIRLLPWGRQRRTS